VLTAPGGVRLKVTKRIVRCAATNVDPGTGLRDLQIPKALMQAYGHADCGVYAEVVGGGTLAEASISPSRPSARPNCPSSKRRSPDP
jgi:uncharacterized protein YcbX